MTLLHGGLAVPASGMPQARPPIRALVGKARRGFWVGAAILLAGCSGGFDKYFGSDKAPPKPPDPKTATEQSTENAQEVPGKEKEYPNLGSVPQTKPVRQSVPEQTQALAKGLVADRQNARYTDEVIRRDPVQAASAPRSAPATPPKLPVAPGATATPPAQSAAPPAAPPPAPPSAPGVAAASSAPALPQPEPAPATAGGAAPVLPAPQPAQPPPQQMLLGTQVAQAIQEPAQAPAPPAAPMPSPAAPGSASVEQPPAVAPSPAPTMASVAQPQFQPPPPPIIPGQTPLPAATQPAPQQAYPQQAYAPPQQLAALPPATPVATQRPVLTPPPGYGLPPAASALAPPPTAPYVPTATPGQAQPSVLNPIRPPPPPISPALPAFASRAGGYDPAVAEARTRMASANPAAEAAAIADARRRAAFNPGQQVGLILFEHGSASLGPADRTLLQRIAALARQNGAVVRVVGHASGRTGEMNSVRHMNRNLNISEARATAAAAELNAAGLPVERIVIEAKGDSEPVYSEAMPSGEAGNRRVDVYLQ
jgi:flagellar motor protein MotB